MANMWNFKNCVFWHLLTTCIHLYKCHCCGAGWLLGYWCHLLNSIVSYACFYLIQWCCSLFRLSQRSCGSCIGSIWAKLRPPWQMKSRSDYKKLWRRHMKTSRQWKQCQWIDWGGLFCTLSNSFGKWSSQTKVCGEEAFGKLPKECWNDWLTLRSFIRHYRVTIVWRRFLRKTLRRSLATTSRSFKLAKCTQDTLNPAILVRRWGAFVWTNPRILPAILEAAMRYQKSLGQRRQHSFSTATRNAFRSMSMWLWSMDTRQPKKLNSFGTGSRRRKSSNHRARAATVVFALLCKQGVATDWTRRLRELWSLPRQKKSSRNFGSSSAVHIACRRVVLKSTTSL